MMKHEMRALAEALIAGKQAQKIAPGVRSRTETQMYMAANAMDYEVEAARIEKLLPKKKPGLCKLTPEGRVILKKEDVPSVRAGWFK